MTVPVLVLDRVSRQFGTAARPVLALNDVSLSVGEGERIGIVGESGSGKTTLARIVLGLTPPTSGRVTLLGRDVSAHRGADRAFIHRHAQMVFQDPLSSLNPRKSVRQIIALPLEAQRIGTAREREAAVKVLIESVGLPARHLDARPAQLSGGQRQRVGIARALAISPKLLLLDEPTASLDVSVQARILELLSRLQAERRIAQVMVSHNLGVIRHAADRVAVMYLGQIVELTSTARLYAAPAHPYTQALFAAVPSVGEKKRDAPKVRAKGEVASATNIPAGCAFHPRCPQAMDRCRTVVPGVSTVAPDHSVRCHLYSARG
ncbi:MAG: ABC transporter ATP-binding protein [Alphaproteobacteria bacterium]|nr:ABC transporter ATP-binding protein [Alphaproteobacteria bacterium]